MDERTEVLAEQLVGPEAGHPLDGVGQERQPGITIDRPDHIGRVLHEEAVALLGLAQLSLETGPLGHVADRALGADPRAVLEHAGACDLCLERRPVLADEDERDPLDEIRVAAHRREFLTGDPQRVRVGQEREVLADDALDRPPEQCIGRVGHEREHAVGVDAPDHIGRGLDEAAETCLFRGDPRKEPRVGERDGCLVGQALEQVQVVGLERPRRRGGDGERADDVATRGPEWCGGHADQTHPSRHRLVVGLVWDARIGQVIGRPDRGALHGGQAVDPAAEREAHTHQPRPGRLVVTAGDDERDEVGAVRCHPGQVCPVALEQTPRLLHHPLEELVGIGQGGDPSCDIAQRALGLGPASESAPRALQLLDKARVGDGDRRLFGEAAEDHGVELVERRWLVTHHLDRTERSGVADDRRRDEPADVRQLGQRIGQDVVVEFSGLVVVDEEDAPLGDRLAGDTLADAEGVELQRLALGFGQARVVRPYERVAIRVVLVDHRAVRAEEALRLVDDGLQDLVRLAQGGDAGGDLAKGALRLGATLDVRL